MSYYSTERFFPKFSIRIIVWLTEIYSFPAVYTPVIRPTHISMSYADSTCSSNSDVSPFFYEGIWLEGPDDEPQDLFTEQTPLLSAPDTFDPELDGFSVNITEPVPLKPGDLESGPLVQAGEVVGIGARLSSFVRRLWGWIKSVFQNCGLVADPEAVDENESEEEEQH